MIANLGFNPMNNGENIIINVEIGGNSNDSSGMHRIEILNSNKLKNTAEANTPTPTSDGNDTTDENVVISNNTEQQQYEDAQQRTCRSKSITLVDKIGAKQAKQPAKPYVLGHPCPGNRIG
jgi:hypothetical protein